MHRALRKIRLKHLVLAAMVIFVYSVNSWAMIEGVNGTNFFLSAKAGRISTADGNSVYTWGFALNGSTMQYPGPTLIVNQGDIITVTLRNNLPVSSGNVSIVFPGHKVAASGGVTGILTQEAPPDGLTLVTYSFTATNPGTYMYHSGTRPELQVEMGLSGAIIVRPSGYNPASPRAYNHLDSSFDYEDLFFLTEMDPRIHDLVDVQGPDAVYNTDYLSNYFPNYWFINGRTAMDTMAAAGVPWLPHQPYNSMPMMHPGNKLLMRVVGAGRDFHPLHHHGNHAKVVARDGRLLESAPGAGADIGASVFTILTVPGETVDAIFEWTGKGLGWDIYGTGDGFAHNCIDGNGDDLDDTTSEYCPDHGKPFPVVLPENQDITIGALWSGSPLFGINGSLPPGEGGLNPFGAFTYMIHSHNEKELTNYDLFPGGMMTILLIVPHSVSIE